MPTPHLPPGVPVPVGMNDNRSVGDFVELWSGGAAPERVTLASDRVSLGRNASNEIALDGDDVSRVHALLERVGGGWVITDLGSRNGTVVNGARILAATALRDGDAVRLGRHQLVLRCDADGAPTTADANNPPELSARERDVLVALCRPLLQGHAFTAPASTREIAAEMYVSVGAVKQHLRNLAVKFRLGPGDHRRVALADAAIRTGAISAADLLVPPR